MREVDAFVCGDVDTPVTETVNGEVKLIRDCRVHDRLTFIVPSDLPSGIYQIRVAVPNITGEPSLGDPVLSTREYINVVPSPTAKFEAFTEKIIARKETSPEWVGSDEVGLRILSYRLFEDGQLEKISLGELPGIDFKNLQSKEFDTGTVIDIPTKVFRHDQPIGGLILGVRGYEIDSQRAYNEEITMWSAYFEDAVEKTWKYVLALIGSVITGLGEKLSLKKLAVLVAGIAVAWVAIAALIAIWAPADLIIDDLIVFSAAELDNLTNVNVPIPSARSFTTEAGIEVNVNKTIPAKKVVFQYIENREYVADEGDSRYGIIYRFNRIT